MTTMIMSLLRDALHTVLLVVLYLLLLLSCELSDPPFKDKVVIKEGDSLLRIECGKCLFVIVINCKLKTLRTGTHVQEVADSNKHHQFSWLE